MVVKGYKYKLKALTISWVCFITLSLKDSIGIDAFQPLIFDSNCSLHRHRNKNQRSCILYATVEKYDKKPLENIEVKKEKDEETIYIRFSRAFQRHLVFKCGHEDSCSLHDCGNGENIGSYIFLDDALEAFPSAQFVKLRDVVIGTDERDYELILGGMGTMPSTKMIESCKTPSSEVIQKCFQYLNTLSWNGKRKSLPLNAISSCRLASHTTDTIHHNYNRVMDLLTRARNRNYTSKNLLERESKNTLLSITKVGLAFDESGARQIIAEFPQLCLYDIHELEDRIKFMISPSWKSYEDLDFYQILRKGFGAGLSIEQATKVVAAAPQFLSMHHEDSRKPSMVYFYKTLHIPPLSLSEARSELSQYMLGCDASDVCAFAYLHSLGVTWDQIRLLLDAFPTLTYSEKDPSWDLLDRSMRSELNGDWLHYIRKRLQISNADIHSMLKVHSRLSGYGIENTISTLDALQVRLNLSSSELKRLVLRMPSIIGIQVDNTIVTSSLDKKVNFFLDEVQLSSDQLKDAVLKQPSLLQYSLDSLQSKCKFLVDEIEIPEESLARVISLAPVILGLSLKQNLRPTVSTFKTRCNFSSKELGEIIVTCPTILTLSEKRKIEPCLSFLSTNLYISSSRDLGNIIKSTPRILLQGVETSLARKLDMMKDAIRKENKDRKEQSDDKSVAIKAAQIMTANPALLATTNSILQNRIKKFQKDPKKKDIASVFGKSRVGRKRMFEITDQSASIISTDIRSNTDLNHSTKPLKLFDEKTMTMSITAHVSGSTYPPENIDQVRGKRKAGGLAIIFPQINDKEDFFNFESAMGMSFGMPMQEVDGGSDPKNGLVLVGFPFLRPSRNRCDLYACHAALKVVSQLLKQASLKRDMTNAKVNVEIYSDSSYAWKLLRNSTQLEKWGSLASVEDFTYDGDGPLERANSDLLYPLTQTLQRLVVDGIINLRGEKVIIGEVNVDFRHSGDCNLSYGYVRELNHHAKNAAKWQFSKG